MHSLGCWPDGRTLSCPTLPGTEGFPGQKFSSRKIWIVQIKTEHLVTLVGLYSLTCNPKGKRSQMDYYSHQFTRIYLICKNHLICFLQVKGYFQNADLWPFCVFQSCGLFRRQCVSDLSGKLVKTWTLWVGGS